MGELAPRASSVIKQLRPLKSPNANYEIRWRAREMAHLSDEMRQKITRDNAKAFYGLTA